MICSGGSFWIAPKDAEHVFYACSPIRHCPLFLENFILRRGGMSAIVISKEDMFHWGTLAVLFISLAVVNVLLFRRCRAYWEFRIEQWRRGGRKKQDDSDSEE